MRTILYKRVNMDEQADSGFSLQYQEQVLRQFCEYNKFEIVGVYTEDYSGKDFNRPEWSKLMNFLKKNRGKVDQVICLRWDRWSRNLHYALDEIKKLSSFGVKINTVEQPIDIENPDSKVLLSLYLTLPKVENDKNSMRTNEGSRRARMEGYWTGSAPRGYDCFRTEEFLRVEDILLPEGLVITLDEIFNTENPEPITVDKENVIQGGIITYLLAVKNGETSLRVIRTNKLQKINIGLASAA